MAGLVLKNVNKIYPGGPQAVRDFHLEIESGELLVLAGPEGCGKSTLLRLIAGLEELNSGEIYMDGQNLKDIEPRDRRMAMLFKNSVLYPQLSVADNLVFALKMAKMPQMEIDSRLARAAEFFQLEGILDKMPENLTMEEGYLALLARAVIRAPKVLLLDRPVSGLDPELQVRLWKLFVNFQKALGITVIYATDNHETAKYLGTRMIVMNDGVICQDDIPKNIYDHPANSFVAGFVGEPSMNIFSAAIAEKDGKMWVKFPGGQAALPEKKAQALRSDDAGRKEIYMGIRPEFLRLAENPKDAVFTAAASGCVALGGQNYVKFMMEETECMAAAEPNVTFEAGKKLSFTMEPDQIYLFDKETGKTI